MSACSPLVILASCMSFIHEHNWRHSEFRFFVINPGNQRSDILYCHLICNGNKGSTHSP